VQAAAPLRPMTTEERLVADFDSTGITLGPHPMAYHRAEMNAAGVLPAASLRGMPDGTYARIAGAVIARQRPGAAEGFIFLSLEDETGISNAIINPQLYERNRITVTRGKFLRVDGTLQNQDGVVNVRADPVRVFEDFSFLDLISHGRAELIVGRGVFTEPFPLLGFDLNDYHELFEEKLDLLQRLNQAERITWSGQFRSPLRDAEISPRPPSGPIASMGWSRRHTGKCGKSGGTWIADGARRIRGADQPNCEHRDLVSQGRTACRTPCVQTESQHKQPCLYR
jgi:Luciferase-like monooxygenase/OB-fold nucleic acid binding domain